MNNPPKKGPRGRPERPPPTPELDAIANVVEADDGFIGMITFTHDAERFEIEPSLRQGLQAIFGGRVIWKHRDQGFGILHWALPPGGRR